MTSETKWTKGEWTAANMIHAETGKRLTPEEIGKYVANAVRKRPECDDFLFISAEKEDGPYDICHIGNGPDGPANAHLIAAAPRLYDELEQTRKIIQALIDYGYTAYLARLERITAALAAARGEQ